MVQPPSIFLTTVLMSFSYDRSDCCCATLHPKRCKQGLDAWATSWVAYVMLGVLSVRGKTGVLPKLLACLAMKEGSTGWQGLPCSMRLADRRCAVGLEIVVARCIA